MTANQITVLLDPAQMPNQSQDQPTFDKLWAAVLAAIPTFGAQFNAAVAAFNVVAAGGAYAIPYTVDLSSTADADPTSGKLRFNAANQNAATTLFADLVGADTIDYTSILDQFDASTNTVKGQIRIVKQGDPAKFLTFDVTARATATGYRKLVVANTGGSSANPFGANEAVLIKFTRTGDKGATGNLPLAQYVKVSERSQTTTAGNGVSGTNTRILNTVEVNTLPGASLASNTVTLPAGTYRFRGRAPAIGVGSHACYLYNSTDSTIIQSGSSAQSAVGGSNQTDSTVTGFFVLAATKGVQLRHYITQTATSGLGLGTSVDGVGCVYSELEFEKIV
jgi:hypothetical protein